MIWDRANIPHIHDIYTYRQFNILAFLPESAHGILLESKTPLLILMGLLAKFLAY